MSGITEKNNIGQLVQTARKTINLSQTDLANQIGVTQSAIAHIESGKSEPREITLIALAKVLNDNFGLEWLNEHLPIQPYSGENTQNSVLQELTEVATRIEEAIAWRQKRDGLAFSPDGYVFRSPTILRSGKIPERFLVNMLELQRMTRHNVLWMLTGEGQKVWVPRLISEAEMDEIKSVVSNFVNRINKRRKSETELAEKNNLRQIINEIMKEEMRELMGEILREEVKDMLRDIVREENAKSNGRPAFYIDVGNKIDNEKGKIAK